MFDPQSSVGRPICSSCSLPLECAAHLVPAANGAALIAVCRGCFLVAQVRLTLLVNGPGTSARSCAETGLESLYDSLVGEQRQTAHVAQSFLGEDVRVPRTSGASASTASTGTLGRTRSRSRSRAFSRPKTRSPLRRRSGGAKAASSHGTEPGICGSWIPGPSP